jgi:hypothetical protein
MGADVKHGQRPAASQAGRRCTVPLAVKLSLRGSVASRLRACACALVQGSPPGTPAWPQQHPRSHSPQSTVLTLQPGEAHGRSRRPLPAANPCQPNPARAEPRLRRPSPSHLIPSHPHLLSATRTMMQMQPRPSCLPPTLVRHVPAFRHTVGSHHLLYHQQRPVRARGTHAGENQLHVHHTPSHALPKARTTTGTTIAMPVAVVRSSSLRSQALWVPSAIDVLARP